MSDEQDKYRHISVNDDDAEEVVVHSGSRTRTEGPEPTASAPGGNAAGGKAATPVDTPKSAAPSTSADTPAPIAVEGISDAKGSSTTHAGSPAETAEQRKNREFRERAEEVARAEAELESKAPFPKIQIAVVACIIVAVILFIVYVVTTI